ncbi:MAG: ABC transporter ATP-binding protein, partial [Acidobacteriota bacterium]|nr:ABC transporter ATP-binding protein [Acidobacteriota bacterium]
GLERHYRGSATLDGVEIATMDRRALARRVAVVPQEPNFEFPFTALEIVLMGRHPHLAGLAFESTQDVEIARGALERCDALDLADRPIDRLSAGERQRVVCARALAQEPDVLLLDEPASFLDIRNQVAIYDLVRETVQRRNVAVLTVMHDLNLAAEYCDRIYLLDDGCVFAGGTTAEVLTYANLTKVFRAEVYVDTNALTGNLLVVPLPGNVQRALHPEATDSDQD